MNWFKKYKWWVVVGVGVIFVSLANASPTPTSYTSAPAPQAVRQNTQYPPQQPAPQVKQPALSNDNYYTNSVGNTVHSPAYSNTGSVPAGASARCRDGTYSFSQSHRGTCSHHGGVESWLY